MSVLLISPSLAPWRLNSVQLNQYASKGCHVEGMPAWQTCELVQEREILPEKAYKEEHT